MKLRSIARVIGGPPMEPKPILTEVTPVPAEVEFDSAIEYTFNSTEAGEIHYTGGDGNISGDLTHCVVGDNTINFTALLPGTFDDLTITVEAKPNPHLNSKNELIAGEAWYYTVSNTLAIPSFRVRGLLFDEYPGELGYSLRKLRATQVNSIRVRRESDGQETDIGFDGKLLDQVALLDFVNALGVSNGYVTKFYNQSPITENLYDAFQNDPNLQPIIVNAGVVIQGAGSPDGILPTKAMMNFGGARYLDIPHPSVARNKEYLAAFLDCYRGTLWSKTLGGAEGRRQRGIIFEITSNNINVTRFGVHMGNQSLSYEQTMGLWSSAGDVTLPYNFSSGGDGPVEPGYPLLKGPPNQTTHGIINNPPVQVSVEHDFLNKSKTLTTKHWSTVGYINTNSSGGTAADQFVDATHDSDSTVVRIGGGDFTSPFGHNTGTAYLSEVVLYNDDTYKANVPDITENQRKYVQYFW